MEDFSCPESYYALKQPVFLSREALTLEFVEQRSSASAQNGLRIPSLSR